MVVDLVVLLGEETAGQMADLMVEQKAGELAG